MMPGRGGQIAIAAIAVAIAAPAAAADPAPGDAVLAVAPGELGDLLDRLRGQRVRVAGDRRSIAIDDIAGEGRPWVGVVERRGDALWLVAPSGPLRLRGPLARPRIAGPGYTVWATGRRDGDALVLRRIGVLRRPRVSGSRSELLSAAARNHLGELTASRRTSTPATGGCSAGYSSGQSSTRSAQVTCMLRIAG